MHCGTVDSGYHGTVSVTVFNFSHIYYNIEVGDRITQVIFEKHCCPKFIELSEHEWENIVKDESNNRKQGGFGPTGK